MKRLLFTGGTGFLGKNIMPLLTKTYEVVTCGSTPDDAIQANLAKEVPQLDQHFDVVLHACGDFACRWRNLGVRWLPDWERRVLDDG